MLGPLHIYSLITEYATNNTSPTLHYEDQGHITITCVFLMRWGRQWCGIFHYHSFNKTETAVFPCRLCFLRAFPFISLISLDLNIVYSTWLYTRCVMIHFNHKKICGSSWLHRLLTVYIWINKGPTDQHRSRSTNIPLLNFVWGILFYLSLLTHQKFNGQFRNCHLWSFITVQWSILIQ